MSSACISPTLGDQIDFVGDCGFIGLLMEGAVTTEEEQERDRCCGLSLARSDRHTFEPKSEPGTGHGEGEYGQKHCNSLPANGFSSIEVEHRCSLLLDLIIQVREMTVI